MMNLLFTLRDAVVRRLRPERGQGTTEYALLLTLIAIVTITALHHFGTSVTAVLSTAANSV